MSLRSPIALSTLTAMLSGCVLGLDDPLPPIAIEPATPVFVEAEEMAIDGFIISDNGAASEGALIQVNGTGTATYLFQGATSTYDLRIFYFDENDGVSHMDLNVDTTLARAWDWDQDLGDKNASAATRTSILVTDLMLAPDTVIELVGESDGEELLRTDRLEFLPSVAVDSP